MALPENTNHEISLDEAKQLITNQRNSEKTEDVKAEFFHKDAIKKLINQDGVAGMRIYHAKTNEGKKCLVLVGVDENNKDMTEGTILEKGGPCPPYCDNESNLI